MEEEKREKKKQQAQKLEAEKRTQLQPSLLETVEKLASGSKSVAGSPNKGLIDLLKYFFNPPTEGLSKMKHPQLVDVVEGHLNSFCEHRFEA
jgi:hypothetical protein